MTRITEGLCPSLTIEIVEKLHAKGIRKVQDFVAISPEKITSLCEISFKKVVCIRRILLEQYSSFPVSGTNLYEECLQTLAILPTGSPTMNDLLEMGIYTGEITEITGVAAAGKTQFCMSLALEIAATLKQNVLFIDTNFGFTSQRIAELLKQRFPDMKHVTSTLNKIHVSQCFSVHELLNLITEIRQNLLEVTNPFYNGLKLIIIDSVTAIISPYLFSTDLTEGRSMISIVGRKLNMLTTEFALAIITTNDLVSQEGTQKLKPALGVTWKNVASTRLSIEPFIELCSLENQKNDNYSKRKLIVHKSTRSPINSSAVVKISGMGVQ